MSDLLTLLKEEQTRVANALPTFAVGSEEHRRAFELLRALRWEVKEIESPLTTDVTAPPPTFTPVPPVEPEAEEHATDAADTAPAFDVEEYKAALRSRMADARLGGADTKAWLSEVGATKFSAITDPCKLMRLNELVTEFEKEKG